MCMPIKYGCSLNKRENQVYIVVLLRQGAMEFLLDGQKNRFAYRNAGSNPGIVPAPVDSALYHSSTAVLIL